MSNYIFDVVKLIVYVLGFGWALFVLWWIFFGREKDESVFGKTKAATDMKRAYWQTTEDAWLDASNAVEVWKVLHTSRCAMPTPEEKELYAKLTQLLKEGAMGLLYENTTNKAQ